MSLGEPVISGLYKIINGTVKIEQIGFNTHYNRSRKPNMQKWTCEIINICCSSPFEWHTENEIIAIISPNVFQSGRLDCDQRLWFNVLASATTNHGLISHTIDLSPPIPFLMDIWSGSHIEFYVAKVDSQKAEYSIIKSFQGIVHVLFRKVG